MSCKETLAKVMRPLEDGANKTLAKISTWEGGKIFEIIQTWVRCGGRAAGIAASLYLVEILTKSPGAISVATKVGNLLTKRTLGV